MGVDLHTYRARIGTYRHSHGVDIVTVVLCVNFSHGMKTVGCVLFISILLVMAGVEQNPGPRESDEETISEDDSQNCSDALQCYEDFRNMKPTSIKVTGLPSGITDDYLVMFFENEKRQGGGSVREVTLCDNENSFIVDFVDTSAVKKVMQKQPIVMKGTTVNIEFYVNIKSRKNIIVQRISADTIQPTKLKIKGLPKGVTNEILRICFEHKSMKCSEAVTGVTIDSDKQLAVVEFDKDAAAQIVMQKQPSIILGTEVKIRVIENKRQTKIKVTGLPLGTTDDYLVMFFENEKRQGGGSVREVMVSDNGNSAFVDFEEPSAVIKVMQKQPIHILKTNVEVVVVNSTRIEVTELPTGITKEILQLYFENESRQADGTVKDVTIDDMKSTAVVEFHEAAAVQIVMKKQPVFILGSEVVIQALTHSDIETHENQTRKTAECNLQQQATSSHESEQSTSDHYEELRESEGTMFFQVLEKLGLDDKYPNKISMNDVRVIDLDKARTQCVTLQDIPWVMLKQLTCAHSEFREMEVTEVDDTNNENNTDLDNSMYFISDKAEESQGISPLDIFTVVFQCCDPFVKQFIFQKLYLCKIAVPFLYKHWISNKTSESILSIWPLRSLAIETITQSVSSRLKSEDIDLLELKTNVLAFARFGRPRYSKSKLLNNLLTTQGCKTFFNFDCPSGRTPRNVSNGNIEMFWLPTTGDKKDRFQHAMTFLNMRGDLNENFEVRIQSFIASFVDVVMVFIDIDSILKKAKEVKAVLVNFSSVILVIADPVESRVQEIIKGFQSEVVGSKHDMKFRVLSTHKGNVEQNVVDMVFSISKHITSHVKSSDTKSIQERLNEVNIERIKTDEQYEKYEQGKVEAETLFKQMKQDGESRLWKQLLTPVHSRYSKQLGILMKRRERGKDITDAENIDFQINGVRSNQTRFITKTMKMFICSLLRNEESPIKLKLFLGWLHFYIERETRRILPELVNEKRDAWDTLKTVKSGEDKDSDEIEKQEKIIAELEEQINDASFSVQHFFREMGHIYEAVLELNEKSSNFDLPPLDKIARIVSNLIADGHQLELIDGESFYMPYLWTKTVLKHVDERFDSIKVLPLSVLGVQSSGKSTLLNIMFGSQFPTRTGRCSRGIQSQLIPVKNWTYEGVSSPFTYVLIIDTEGLRAPEITRDQHEHDNELATVITGLADITIFNIMGENTSEIRDILQVIVHAFLRLKMANRSLDIRKRCAFIHQNVTETSASDNMMCGLSKLIQTLDEMTRESARSEGIRDTTTFNQVIEFDINSQVWYLKNLWQGNPPMARINNEYSEDVSNIKSNILQKALQMKCKSYKTLTDILEHAYCLWKGVLNEDFVFSFRNSLEIKAYMEMEKFVQKKLWQLEKSICEYVMSKTQKLFACCDKTEGLLYVADNLKTEADNLKTELNDMVANKRCDTEKVINKYFETNRYNDITIKWKNSQKYRIDTLCLQLEQIITEQVLKRLGRRTFEIVIRGLLEKLEKNISRKSEEVANQYRVEDLSSQKINTLFADIWQTFIVEIEETNSHSIEVKRKNMKDIFINYLKCLTKNNSALLKDALAETKNLEPIKHLEKLSGSFQDTSIDETHISWLNKLKGMKDATRGNTIKTVKTRVNQIFEFLDQKINGICQVNDEITEMTIKTFMNELHDRIHDKLTGHTEYDFKQPFYVKMYVHVGRYAHPVFEEHNENYYKTQGIAALIEQYKVQHKIRFESKLRRRQSEDTAVELFSNVIQTFAEEWVIQILPFQITDLLLCALPSLKNKVIIEMCKELIDKNDFVKVERYIQAPNEYASLWITEKANRYLFDDETHAYKTLATTLLEELFETVTGSVVEIKHQNSRKSATSFEIWINAFQESLKKKDFLIQPERFLNLKIVKHIENFEHFTNKIIENMMRSEVKLKEKFSQHNRESVKWSNTNPIDKLIKQIWGCSERCAFCGEPCAKSGNHEGSSHFSKQHRPSCCIGVKYSTTNRAVLESCEFYIQSDREYHCKILNYICNEKERKPCGRMHSYRNYKTYMPSWDITPTSNMYDISQFWMWVLATYTKELRERYDYKIDNIPKLFYSITKDQAKASLEKTYSA